MDFLAYNPEGFYDGMFEAPGHPRSGAGVPGLMEVYREKPHSHFPYTLDLRWS